MQLAGINGEVVILLKVEVGDNVMAEDGVMYRFFQSSSVGGHIIRLGDPERCHNQLD